MTHAARLLLVEDDAELSAMLAGLFSDEGYHVAVAPDGQRALHLGLTQSYDVMVLDRSLPAIEGLDVLGRLRRAGVSTPTLVLSALGNPADRVEGLDAGAEDYLGKPFDLDELMARLRALLRRNDAHAESLPVPGGHLSAPTRSVLLADGTEVALTDREAALLELLARNASRTFSRSDLLDLVFEGSGEDNLVDTYVHYLRRKLGRGVVITVRGLGYRAGR